ncbi:MAG: OmpA family protein [Bacteroidota bacterium]
MPTPTQAQEGETIYLSNASFEDYPRVGTRHGRPHRSWYDCGRPTESVPDVQPSGDPDNLFFGVKTAAYEGSTYLGLVVRDNDTWEGLSQRLRAPLEAGKCYTFSLYLAKSKVYLSPARDGKGNADHNGPVKIRIWGGSNFFCDRTELLDETSLIRHEDWREYSFRFEPREQINFITIEAFYKTPSLILYNGNVLVDNASPIRMISCGDEPTPIVKIVNPIRERTEVKEEAFSLRAQVKHVEKKQDIKVLVNRKPVKFRYNSRKKEVTVYLTLLKGMNKVEVRARNNAGDGKDDVSIMYDFTPADAAPIASVDPPKPAPPRTPPSQVSSPTKDNFKYLPELDDPEKIREGQEIRLNKLYFDVDSDKIKRDAYPILDEVYRFLRKNPSVVVEIGGHTNNRCDDSFCNKLSKARAKAVSDYLVGKGIPTNRMKHKGYGKNKPVATNATPTGRKRNQRVELKILSFKG